MSQTAVAGLNCLNATCPCYNDEQGRNQLVFLAGTKWL